MASIRKFWRDVVSIWKQSGRETAMRLDKNKLKELCEKATPGPWEVNDHSKDESCLYIESPGDGVCSVFTNDHDNSQTNAEFIAEARTALPDLLKENSELEERVRELTQQVEVAVSERATRYQDGECYFCHEFTNSLHGNPSLWPLYFCHADDPGRPKPHHIGCVSRRLSKLSVMETALRQIVPKLNWIWSQNSYTFAECTIAEKIMENVEASAKIAMKALSDQGGNNGA